MELKTKMRQSNVPFGAEIRSRLQQMQRPASTSYIDGFKRPNIFNSRDRQPAAGLEADKFRDLKDFEERSMSSEVAMNNQLETRFKDRRNTYQGDIIAGTRFETSTLLPKREGPALNQNKLAEFKR